MAKLLTKTLQIDGRVNLGLNRARPGFNSTPVWRQSPDGSRSNVRRLLTYVSNMLTSGRVIRTFISKSLADLWSTGRSAKIDQKMHRRILIRLDRLNVAASPTEMNVPGFNFHALRGFDPVRHSVHVNGPWCVTFEFSNGDAWRVDFEQYH